MGEDSQLAGKQERRRRVGPAGIASILFSISALFMLQLYGLIHWRIMFPPMDGFSEGQRAGVFAALGELGALRLAFALLACIFCAVSFRRESRVLAWLSCVLAILATMTAFVVM